MIHIKKVKQFIINNYDYCWDIDNCINKGDNVEICDNGDVHYNNWTIIKTGINL